MANNCLKTQLNGVVDNDNLPKFGEMTVDVHALQSDTQRMRLLTLNSATPLHVSITGNGVLDRVEYGSDVFTNVTDITLPSNTTCYLIFGVGEYKCHFDSKYGFINLNNDANVSNPKFCFGIKLEDVKYCTQLTNLKSAYNCSGNIEDLANLVLLTSINLRNTNVVGNIKVFENCPNISSITVNMTGVNGTLESLAESLVAKGRTSGTLIISSTTISYQGVIYNGAKQITFDPTASGGYTVTTLE